MEGYEFSNRTTNWIIVVGIIVVVAIALICIIWATTNGPKIKEENSHNSSDPNFEQVLEPIPEPPPEFPETTCIRPDGTKTKCGYESRIRSNVKESRPKGAIPELLLRNNSPLNLDIYHRLPDGTKFIFAGTIPTMQEMYTYKDKEGNNFYKNSDLFAARHKEIKILYLPVSLDPSETKIVWGLSSSNIDESVVTINLLGEISHIKFRNYSYATYKLYYYNEYLGELKPYQKEEGTYYEFYVHRGGQGFRLGSKVTILMEGTDQAQDIVLDKRNMTTLNVGLALAEKISNN